MSSLIPQGWSCHPDPVMDDETEAGRGEGVQLPAGRGWLWAPPVVLPPLGPGRFLEIHLALTSPLSSLELIC